MATWATSSQASRSLPPNAEGGNGLASGDSSPYHANYDYTCPRISSDWFNGEDMLEATAQKSIHTAPAEPAAESVAEPVAEPAAKSVAESTTNNQHHNHHQPPQRQLSLRSSKRQLSDYRQRLTRDMSARVGGQAASMSAAAAPTGRPSPVQEEKTPSPVVVSSTPNHTAATSASPTISSTGPPSFPFPRALATSNSLRPSDTPGEPVINVDIHTKRQACKPSANSDDSFTSFRSEKMLPTPSTSASTATFLPSDALNQDPVNGLDGSNGVSSGHRKHRRSNPSNPEFPSPNLYELALTLSSEPGLDAWWNNVVQVATEWYKAERVALIIPADPTDVENMPWGQRATFNAHERDDELSLGYMGKSSHAFATDVAVSEATSIPPVSVATSPLAAAPPMRPTLFSRHSYTAYETHRSHRAEPPSSDGQPSQIPARPPLPRSHSMRPVSTRLADMPKADLPESMPPPQPYTSLNQTALEEHDATENTQHPVPSWEKQSWHREEPRGRVLPVLQALGYEADPLIDHNGVQRVLDRGHVVALTRSYPYLNPSKDEADNGEEKQPPPPAAVEKQLRPERTSKLSGLNRTPSASNRPSGYLMKKLNGMPSAASKSAADDEVNPKLSAYEEYEQFPPSPWSQSPVASPMVRADPEDNPFFREALVDEDSFNPELAPKDYKGIPCPPAIGVDNAWTVLHVPLFHPTLSKPSTSFKLDATKMQRRSSPRRNPNELDHENGPSTTVSSASSERLGSQLKRVPIAILSILSPVIPYPTNLRRSLEFLSPHLATSFSLCFHYSNLEVELSNRQRRRHDPSGFGGVDAEGRILPTSSATTNTPCLSCFQSDDAFTHRSMAESAASFSDFSGPSRSAAGSPGGTPGWDASSTLSTFLDRRTNTGSAMSPSVVSLGGGDGYFGMRPTALGHFGRPATTPGGSSNGSVPRTAGKYTVSAGEKRLLSLQTLEGLSPTRDANTSTPITAALGEPALSSPIFAHSRRAPKRRSSTLYDIVSGPIETPVAGLEGVYATGKRTVSSGAGSAETEQPLLPEPRLSTAETEATTTPTVAAVLAPETDKETNLEELARAVLSTKAPLLSSLSPGGHLPNRRHSQRAAHRHSRSHSHLHSQGADFASTFPCLPPSASINVKGGSGAAAAGSSTTAAPVQAGSPTGTGPVDMPPPSDRLKGLILDSLPAHVFVALPQTGAIVWVNSRYLAYRGQTVESLAEDPWGSIHPEEREGYLKAWSHSVRTGEQFSRTVRIRRFDGLYRWFHARAVASRDRRGSIVQFLGSYMDIHDQYIAEVKAARQAEIEVSESKHRVLANLIPQIVFTANEADGVTFANEQWPVYTGQRSQDALGLGFINFVHPEDMAKCRIVSSTPRKEKDENTGNGKELMGELAEMARQGLIMVTVNEDGRLSYATEVRLRSKTGEYRWHLVRCAETDSVGFGRGMANSYFGSATDINDHKLLETKLKDAMESKTRFLSNMSHEIRTPLIGISGMVSFLQDTTLDEEQRDYTDTIQSSASSLLMIINDILDLSKVDAGMMKLSFEWFHTRSLIEDVNELVSAMAIGKGLELNYVVEADVPSWVKGDRVRIRQVLLNVIGNAIKFTAQGEVFSRCRVVAGGGKNGKDEKGKNLASDRIMLEFSVTDTGQGFTKEEADLIFKPFSQIDGSSTRQHGGSGLGLVISRQLVELHGGHMKGTAEPGRGSTFTFTAQFGLPTEADHPGELATPPLEERSSGKETPFFLTPNAVAAAAASAAGAGLEEFSEARRASKSEQMEKKEKEETQAAERSQAAEMVAAETTTEIAETTTAKPTEVDKSDSDKPRLSILIVCPQTYSREATVAHIAMTLPKEERPHRITAVATIEEAQELISGGDPMMFSHVVVNLPTAQEVLDVVERLDRSTMLPHARLLVLSDSVQRQAVQRLAAETRQGELLVTARVTYIYKPVKPSRFAVIFDPAKERDLSVDLNRSSAQRLVETQKQSYLDLEQRMGNRGYRVLLVEDNLVNQKVLKRYLHKVGVEVDVAADGVECVEAVLKRPHTYYSLILCDLHMPRKDGYHACREIREWEAAGGYSGKPLPIIALSANVMSDVHDKCVEAGFSKYITKPVDFIALSRALAEFF